MDQLQYQRRLAEYDEVVASHKVEIEKLEHERARFVLDVLNSAIKNRAENPDLKDQPTTIIGPKDAG